MANRDAQNRAEVERFKREIEQRRAAGVALMRKVMLEAFRRIVKRSPFDTTLFKSSHDLTLGSPSTMERGQINGFRIQETKANGRVNSGVTPRALSSQGVIKAFIRNNLPYASALENGHSLQAPNGLYAIVEREVQKFWNREAGKLSRK